MSKRLHAALALSLLVAAACTSGTATTDGGAPDGSLADAAVDAMVSCSEPATTCPISQPHPGAPCELSDTCGYDDVNGEDRWTYACIDGRWDAEVTCMASAPGASCPAPPLAESCRDPFAGSMTGVTVEVGPVSPTEAFRPFTDGEPIDLIFGGQGSPMLAYRLRLAGAPSMPECVRFETTLALGGTTDVSSQTVVLRCGETLTVFTIVPFAEVCDDATFTIDITVDVAGLGVGAATVNFDGGLCVG